VGVYALNVNRYRIRNATASVRSYKAAQYFRPVIRPTGIFKTQEFTLHIKRETSDIAYCVHVSGQQGMMLGGLYGMHQAVLDNTK
jgi:hypothetical protein